MPTPDNTVTLLINGKTHGQWTNYDIVSDLLTPADDFSVTLGRPVDAKPDAVRAGDKVEVRVGGDTVLSGRIDRVQTVTEKGGKTLTIQGRDDAGVLLDCSAPLFNAQDMDLNQIIEKIVKPLGFTSNPPAGSDCVVVPLGGKTSHGIIVTTTNGAYRITGLAEGETAVYNADGAKMVLKKGRIIEIDCETLNIKAPGGVNIDAPNVGCTAQITAEGQINGNGGMAVKGGSGTSFTGNVQMVGDLDTTGKLTNNGKNVGSDHKHSETNGSETGEVV